MIMYEEHNNIDAQISDIPVNIHNTKIWSEIHHVTKYIQNSVGTK